MNPLPYPVARKSDLVETLHGQQIPDPYRWLEEIDSPETRQWIDAQNSLTFAHLEKISARPKLARRIAELWDFEKFTPPWKRGGRYFFTRNDGLQNQAVLYWMENLQAEPRLLLDPNLLSADGTVALVSAEVSPDGNLLAYGVSQAGSDWMTWRVRSVDSGQDLADTLEWVKFSEASWTKDNRGFFYSRYAEPQEGQELAEANYYHKLYFHRLGDPQSLDRLVYERPDEKEWGFDGHVSHDGRYLVISVWRGTHRENNVFYMDLEQPESPVVELLSGFEASYGYIANHGTTFYFLTDLDAPLSRVIAIDLDHPQRAAWREIIPQSEHALQAVTLVGGKFFAHYLQDARSQVRLFHQDGSPAGEVSLPGIGAVVGFSGQPEDDETFYLFNSFTTPGAIYHYQVNAAENRLFRAPVLAFDPADYLVEQVFYPSKDGTPIPMFLCRRKDLALSPQTPCYLYGYGGFNIPITPNFMVSGLTWMELGGLFAVANLRGGGEYGKAWHDAGMKLNKQNVFDDFIAAAEWLISQGYTSTPRLAIGGRSNGGLLIGACLTQRPDLFGACLPIVGVLDMLRFHKFTIGWAWVSDYGSPDDPQEFAALRAYSPYHNLRPGQAYPPTLVCTGDHDDRVYPAHSYKFAAALQSAQAGPAPTLIRIDVKAGHGVGKPTAKLIEELADQWAFLIAALGIEM
jgi:prolyl oligopeptidase